VAHELSSPDFDGGATYTDWGWLYAIFCIPTLERLVLCRARCWTRGSCDPEAFISGKSNVKELCFLKSSPVGEVSPRQGEEDHALRDFKHLLSWPKSLKKFYYEITPNEHSLFVESSSLCPAAYAMALSQTQNESVEEVTLYYDLSKEMLSSTANFSGFGRLKKLDIPITFLLDPDDEETKVGPKDVLPEGLEVLFLKFEHDFMWDSGGSVDESEPKDTLSLYSRDIVGFLGRLVEENSPALRQVVLWQGDESYLQALDFRMPENFQEILELKEGYESKGVELVFWVDADGVTPSFIEDPMGSRWMHRFTECTTCRKYW